MKKYKIDPSLVMDKSEVEAYNSLPDNMPDTKLNTKQLKLVDSLYYKYIANKVVIGWGTELFTIEMREKWPSGPKMKRHEAKRIILNNLVGMQSRKILTSEQAASYFLGTLSCRESWQRLVYYAFRTNL